MRYSTRIKPISYLKANAAEVLDNLQAAREPLIITQNGEAKAVLIDVATYDQLQETAALLKLLSLADRQVEEGLVAPADEAIEAYRVEG